MKVLLLCFALIVAVYSKPFSPATQRLLNKIIQSPAKDIETRIIDGEAAESNQAPYLVSLSISDIVYAHGCSGALIGKEWVLTAAHCVADKKNLTGSVIGTSVYAGLHDRTQFDNAQVRYVDFAMSHKNFNNKVGSDDIALLHVSQAFNFNAHVKPVILPYLNEDFDGWDAYTYGWGLTDAEAVQYATDLQVASATVINKDKCSALLPEDAPISDKQLCVEVTACYGDGGNPLIRQSEGDIYELLGIISWAYLPCGYKNRPTVYTAVSEYVSWIADVQSLYYIQQQNPWETFEQSQ